MIKLLLISFALYRYSYQTPHPSKNQVKNILISTYSSLIGHSWETERKNEFFHWNKWKKTILSRKLKIALVVNSTEPKKQSRKTIIALIRNRINVGTISSNVTTGHPIIPYSLEFITTVFRIIKTDKLYVYDENNTENWQKINKEVGAWDTFLWKIVWFC